MKSVAAHLMLYTIMFHTIRNLLKEYKYTLHNIYTKWSEMKGVGFLLRRRLCITGRKSYRHGRATHTHTHRKF